MDTSIKVNGLMTVLTVLELVAFRQVLDTRDTSQEVKDQDQAFTLIQQLRAITQANGKMVYVMDLERPTDLTVTIFLVTFIETTKMVGVWSSRPLSKENIEDSLSTE